MNTSCDLLCVSLFSKPQHSFLYKFDTLCNCFKLFTILKRLKVAKVFHYKSASILTSVLVICVINLTSISYIFDIMFCFLSLCLCVVNDTNISSTYLSSMRDKRGIYRSCLSLKYALFAFMFLRQSCGRKAAVFLCIEASYLLQSSLGFISYEVFCLLKLAL